MKSFDFPGFKKAFVTKNKKAWVEYFDDNAKWIEYKQRYPPKSPRILAGKNQINEFLSGIAASNIQLNIEDEVIGPERAAFCVWCILPDNKRIIEHVIIHFANGKIVRQVDVEVWD